MAGLAYVLIAVGFGIASGMVGRAKGSSLWIWFLIGAVLPVIGLVAALLYRRETEELRRRCPRCGAILKIYDAKCMRCGEELEFPDVAIESQSAARPR